MTLLHIGNRTILLVGDSTMGQSATTLMSMIAASHGSCSSQVTYYRSYYLVFRNANEASMVDTVLRLRPDILILSAGAHFEDLGDLYNIWNSLTALLKTIIMKQLPRTKLIWKSTNPADDNCMSMHEPLPNYPLIVNVPMKSTFNHHLFRRFDTISKEFAWKLGLSYIDMTPLYMRGDAHVGYYINELGTLSNMSHHMPLHTIILIYSIYSIYLPIHLSIYLSIYLPIYLFYSIYCLQCI
jgi:hypothetical protein